MPKHVWSQSRIHPLSFIPGGVIVTAVKITGEEFNYDKVHYPLSYITTMIEKSHKELFEIRVNGKPFWNRNREVHYVHEQPKRKLVPLTKIAA